MTRRFPLIAALSAFAFLTAGSLKAGPPDPPPQAPAGPATTPPPEPATAPPAGPAPAGTSGGDGPPPARVLGGVKPPPEVQKEIDRSHAADVKASALREAAAAHPDDAHFQVELLEGLLDLGRTPEALDLGPGLVERFPRSPEMVIALGRALMRDGQFEVAGVQFQRAISLDAKSARAHALMARDSFIRGDLKSAETWLRKAIALDSSQRDARALLAQLLERTGRYAEASAMLDVEEAGGAADAGRRALLSGFAKKPPFVLPAEFKRVTVPFLTARGFPPLVQLKVGESVEKYFVVDTASDDVNLTSDAARALGLPERGKTTAKDAEGHEYQTPVYAVLDSVKIGDLTIQRIPVRVSPGLKYPDDRIAGSLGRGFLRRFRVTLDYPARTFTLARAEGAPLEGVPFDLATVILLDGYNGQRGVGKFVLDTSSYTPGAMDIRFVADETSLTVFSQEVKPIKDGGPYLFKFTMPGLKVGGVEFKKFPATAVDLRTMSRQVGVDVRGVVGVSLLRQCRVEIDFRNQRLLLERTAPAAPPPAESGT